MRKTLVKVEHVAPLPVHKSIPLKFIPCNMRRLDTWHLRVMDSGQSSIAGSSGSRGGAVAAAEASIAAAVAAGGVAFDNKRQRRGVT